MSGAGGSLQSSDNREPSGHEAIPGRPLEADARQSLGHRAATPGGAIPYLVLSYTIIVAFLLFVLALIAFVMRVSLSLVFASIAGIGGVLVTSAVAVMYGLRMESAFADLMVVFMFTTPMVAIYLYWRH